MSIFALAGTFYGAIKALAQSRVRFLLAYRSLSFFSMLWWFVAATRSATPRCRALRRRRRSRDVRTPVAWQVVRTRYGDDVDPQAISGLGLQHATVSPCCSRCWRWPPWVCRRSASSPGFMGLLLASPVPSSVGLVIIVLAWLAASSWYILQMVQRLLFGARRADLRYADLLPDRTRCAV